MRTLLITILLGIPAALFGQLTSDSIAVGDISIIGFNSSNPDQFSFYCNNYIEEGIEIYFTDCGWTGTGFYASEGHIKWKSPVLGIPGGTIVTITSTSGAGYFSSSSGNIFASADYGTLLKVDPEPDPINNGMALATSGDQIIAYVDSPTAPFFIACLNFNGTYDAATTSNQTLVPPGLTDGSSCILLTNYDNGVVDCLLLPDPPTISDFANEANWILINITRVTLPPDLTDCTFVLPVSFSNFHASIIDNSVLLDWTTQSELNNDFFTIEKSKNGIIFETLGYLSGAGTSAESIEYSWLDKQPFAGNNYYRIRQTDFNGLLSYSETRYVQWISGLEFTFYPNPSKDMIQLNAPTDGMITIYSPNGRLEFSLELMQGSNALDISELAVGLYLIHWVGQADSKTFKLVKEK